MTDQEEMSFNSGEMFNDLVPPQISSLADLVPLPRPRPAEAPARADAPEEEAVEPE